MSSAEPIVEAEKESTGLPAFPTWSAVYTFVAVFFVILVTLMVLLERAFQ